MRTVLTLCVTICCMQLYARLEEIEADKAPAKYVSCVITLDLIKVPQNHVEWQMLEPACYICCVQFLCVCTVY